MSKKASMHYRPPFSAMARALLFSACEKRSPPQLNSFLDRKAKWRWEKSAVTHGVFWLQFYILGAFLANLAARILGLVRLTMEPSNTVGFWKTWTHAFPALFALLFLSGLSVGWFIFRIVFCFFYFSNSGSCGERSGQAGQPNCKKWLLHSWENKRVAGKELKQLGESIRPIKPPPQSNNHFNLIRKVPATIQFVQASKVLPYPKVSTGSPMRLSL